MTSIGDYAFNGCSSLTNITIPNSVTSIRKRSFSGCSGLTSITIPNSVTSIGGRAFDGTPWIAQQLDDNSIIYINNVLYRCYGVPANTSIEVREGTVCISGHAFFDCDSLTSITIPNSVTSIGDEAFSGCSGLTSITIPNSVTSIGNSAFWDCYRLKNLRIEDGKETLMVGYEYYYPYQGLFYYCRLETLYLGRNIGYLSKQISPFEGNTTLKSVTIGDSVTSIGDNAFLLCYNLKDIINCSDLDIKKGDESHGRVAYYAENVITPDRKIGDYLFRIDNEGIQLFCYLGDDTDLILPGNYSYTIAPETFAGKGDIKSVSIPNSMTSIGNNVFSDCSGLTNVVIGDSVISIGDYAFNGCSSLTNITIPNSVISIGNNVFRDCSNLTDIYLSEALTSIGDNLLVNCPALSSITLGATTPPTSGELGLITKQYFTVKLRVPEGSLAMYKYADEWKKFFDIEKYDPTGIEKTTIDAENESLPIYNLQGVKMTGSKEYLPAGIYIQGGKKILVR